MYVDATPRTGTAQDLMRVVTRAREIETARSGERLPFKSVARRRWVEPPARLLGMAIAGLAALAPAEAALAWHDFLYRRLAAPRHVPFDAARPEIIRAKELARRVEAETGASPALLALVSHAPVSEELGFLNFELVRHATLALRAVRGRSCRPRLLVAVDSFALDTASLFEEGVYAAYMSASHLGFDRLSLGGGGLRAWPALPWRFSRLLCAGGEAALALAGGVPGTARVLYAAREWARAVRGASPLRPAEARARLGSHPTFRRFFENADPALPRPSRPGLLLEAWLMAGAAGLAGAAPREVAAAALECLAVPGKERPALLADLEKDLARETPRRRRFFRFLAGRVAPRRPIVFLPFVHRVDPPSVEPREAWAWRQGEDGGERAGRLVEEVFT
ncbi:MAG: hypothetical protein HY552_05070 [Elusimicrobia bacterium]|nr:hypothetical protein [Elusimicrobiota bacterium]